MLGTTRNPSKAEKHQVEGRESLSGKARTCLRDGLQCYTERFAGGARLQRRYDTSLSETDTSISRISCRPGPTKTRSLLHNELIRGSHQWIFSHTRRSRRDIPWPSPWETMP